MANTLDPATRNLIDRETDSQSKQLARNSASDLVDTLLQDKNNPKGLKGHTFESLASTHKELVDKSVFLLSQFVIKSNDRIKIKAFKDELKADIAANKTAKKNINVEDFFRMISHKIQTKVGAPEFAQWEEQYTNKHPEGLEKDEMKARMDAQTAVMGEVLKGKRTMNTYRYVLHVIADIKEKYKGSPREVAVRIINYIRGIKSKNWIRNNRLTNRAKSARRNKGLL
ncbi:MAG: hypothetical protein LBO09_09225 [Candidatus Peribacteria bacterium]|jgi:hypothetical protein|nr:hypothetical protein [Candidatus Peribacteria bacterium]